MFLSITAILDIRAFLWKMHGKSLCCLVMILYMLQETIASMSDEYAAVLFSVKNPSADPVLFVSAIIEWVTYAWREGRGKGGE